MLPLEEIAHHCWTDIKSGANVNNSAPFDRQLLFALIELRTVTLITVNYTAFVANVFLLMKLNSIIKLRSSVQPPRVFCAMACADAMCNLIAGVCLSIELASSQLSRNDHCVIAGLRQGSLAVAKTFTMYCWCVLSFQRYTAITRPYFFRQHALHKTRLATCTLLPAVVAVSIEAMSGGVLVLLGMESAFALSLVETVMSTVMPVVLTISMDVLVNCTQKMHHSRQASNARSTSAVSAPKVNAVPKDTVEKKAHSAEPLAFTASSALTSDQKESDIQPTTVRTRNPPSMPLTKRKKSRSLGSACDKHRQMIVSLRARSQTWSSAHVTSRSSPPITQQRQFLSPIPMRSQVNSVSATTGRTSCTLSFTPSTLRGGSCQSELPVSTFSRFPSTAPSNREESLRCRAALTSRSIRKYLVLVWIDFCLNIPIIALALFNRNFIWREEILQSAVEYAAESIFLLQFLANIFYARILFPELSTQNGLISHTPLMEHNTSVANGRLQVPISRVDVASKASETNVCQLMSGDAAV